MEWVTEVKTVKRHMVGTHDATFRITPPPPSQLSDLTRPDCLALPTLTAPPLQASCMKREAAEFGNELRYSGWVDT